MKSSADDQKESRVEARDRHRIEAATRENDVRQQRTESEARNRRRLADQLGSWDDDREEEGNEPFFVDRFVECLEYR